MTGWLVYFQLRDSFFISNEILIRKVDSCSGRSMQTIKTSTGLVQRYLLSILSWVLSVAEVLGLF